VTNFIDCRVHPSVTAVIDGPLAPFLPGFVDDTGFPQTAVDPGEIADYYRSRGGRAVLLGWDSESTTGRRPFGSSDVAALTRAHDDVFLGFGAVDAAKGAAAVGQVHEAARLGLVGVALQPAIQKIGPADRTTAPVWEAAAGHGLICLFHTGATRLGAGMPGGAGVRLSASNPMYIDNIAAQLPDLKIVLAHSGRLWRSEAAAIAAHKANVYLCLGGETLVEPDEELRNAVAGPLATKVLFGSGYPFGDPDSWMATWSGMELSDDATRRVLHDNAAELLGIAG
jgi:predicted TIM-barrel fold metal-dependent hydrolase